MGVKVKTHAEHDISFAEGSSSTDGSYFFATIEGKEIRRKTLEEVVSYLDKLNKKTFKRIPIYYPSQVGGYGTPCLYVEGEITSVADSDVWISYGPEKSRTKVGRYARPNLVSRTDSNKEKVVRINELRTKANELIKQAEVESKTLTTVSEEVFSLSQK